MELEFSLKFYDKGWTATVIVLDRCPIFFAEGDDVKKIEVAKVVAVLSPLSSCLQADLLKCLRVGPLNLYALLKGRVGQTIEHYMPSMQPDDVQCILLNTQILHVYDKEHITSAAVQAATVRLQTDPMLRLSVAGLKREVVLRKVFDFWTDELHKTNNPELMTVNKAIVSPDSSDQKKRQNGYTIVEHFIMEAAAQSTLHQPGFILDKIKVDFNAHHPIADFTHLTSFLPQIQTTEAIGLIKQEVHIKAAQIATSVVEDS